MTDSKSTSGGTATSKVPDEQKERADGLGIPPSHPAACDPKALVHCEVVGPKTISIAGALYGPGQRVDVSQQQFGYFTDKERWPEPRLKKVARK